MWLFWLFCQLVRLKDCFPFPFYINSAPVHVLALAEGLDFVFLAPRTGVETGVGNQKPSAITSCCLIQGLAQFSSILFYLEFVVWVFHFDVVIAVLLLLGEVAMRPFKMCYEKHQLIYDNLTLEHHRRPQWHLLPHQSLSCCKYSQIQTGLSILYGKEFKRKTSTLTKAGHTPFILKSLP